MLEGNSQIDIVRIYDLKSVGKEPLRCWNVIQKKTKPDAPVLMSLVAEREDAVSASPITGR